jgi:adenylate kinase
LLGEPAAGKATQAKFLVKKHKLYDLDMGKELRSITNKKLRAKYDLTGTIDKGKLAATELVRDILKDRIFKIKATQGILFDGNPKMVGEARLVAKWLKEAHRTNPVVIYISIPITEAIKRAASRTEIEHGKKVKRVDDTPQVIKKRMEYYRTNIKQVVAFFKTKYQFKKINGVGTIDQVKSRVEKALAYALDKKA